MGHLELRLSARFNRDRGALPRRRRPYSADCGDAYVIDRGRSCGGIGLASTGQSADSIGEAHCEFRADDQRLSLTHWKRRGVLAYSSLDWVATVLCLAVSSGRGNAGRVAPLQGLSSTTRKGLSAFPTMRSITEERALPEAASMKSGTRS